MSSPSSSGTAPKRPRTSDGEFTARVVAEAQACGLRQLGVITTATGEGVGPEAAAGQGEVEGGEELLAVVVPRELVGDLAHEPELAA